MGLSFEFEWLNCGEERNNNQFSNKNNGIIDQTVELRSLGLEQTSFRSRNKSKKEKNKSVQSM